MRDELPIEAPPIKPVKKIRKKKEAVKKVGKKYRVVYTIGNDPTNYGADGTDYKLSTLEVQSVSTGEVFAFPVLFLIDEDQDSMEIIPMNSIGCLKYNFGYKEEQKKFISQIDVIRKMMKERAEELPREEKSTYHG